MSTIASHRLLALQTALSWVAIAVDLLSGFVLAPVLLRELGKELYGVWVVLNSTTALIGLSDLGMRATLFRTVCMTATAHYTLDRTVASLYRALIVAALAALGLSIVVGAALPIASTELSVSATSGQFTTSMALLGACHLLYYVSGAASAHLAAADKNHLATLASTLAVAARIPATLVVAFYVPSLVNLAAVMVLAAALQLALMLFFSRRIFQPVKLARTQGNPAGMRAQLNHTAFAFLARSLATVHAELPVYVTLSILGSSAVATISFCLLLTNACRRLVDAFVQNVVPRIFKAAGKHDSDALIGQFDLLVTFTFAFGGFIAAGLVIFGDDFMRIWLRVPEFEEQAALATLAALSVLMSLGSQIATFLDGLGRYWTTARLMIVDTIACATLMLTLSTAEALGLLGLVIGYAIPKCVSAALMLGPLANALQTSLRRLLGMCARSSIHFPAALVSCATSQALIPPEEWSSLVAAAMASVLFYAPLSLPFVLRSIQTTQRR